MSHVTRVRYCTGGLNSGPVYWLQRIIGIGVGGNFLPRDATQSAVTRLHVVVCPSVRDQVPWSHWLEFFENNFTAKQFKAHALSDPNISDLV